jgi:cathepsin C
MVYDECFDVIFDELSFFAFSKYSIEKELMRNILKFKSFCYSTCVGWYKNKNKTKGGCYVAEKKGFDLKTVLFFNTKKIDNRIQASSADVKEPMRFQQIKKNENNFNSIVENLNKIKKSWIAVEYSQFSNKTISELNKLAGMSRKIKGRGISIKSNKNSFRFNQNEPLVELKHNLESEIETSLLPKNFDWKDKVRVAGNQGACGSCYAWSTMRMLESRINILYDTNVKLSVQHTLDCSYYNQGCRGGYSYLVLKFANEFELIPEHCHPYKAEDGKCKNLCDETTITKYKVSDYSYLGGSYGKCTEQLMMEELRKNGPFVVSIEPDYSFMFYKSGIYHAIDETSWIRQGLSKPEWQKVDHSVLLVGWGEDFETKEKYWLIQNSWGADWGENGYFRIRRGVDELSIESICEVGSPIINKK